MAARSGDVSAATTLSRRADTWAVLRVLTTDHSRCHPAGLRSRSRRASSLIRSELRILALGSAARLISAIRDRASISLCCGNMVELLANKGFDEHDCEEHELEQPQEVVRGVVQHHPVEHAPDVISEAQAATGSLRGRPRGRLRATIAPWTKSSPPQTPHGSARSSALARHSARTGHAPHRALANSTSAGRSANQSSASYSRPGMSEP